MTTSLRSTLDIRAELAELEDYLAGIPAYLATAGYARPYQSRLEELRDLLLLQEARTHASRLDSDIQVMRFRKGWADMHVMPLEHLGNVAKSWHALFHSALDVLRSSGHKLAETTSMTFLALPAFPGSYALEVATKHPQSRELFDVLANGLNSAPSIAALQERFGASPCLDRNAYQALMTLLADEGVELQFSFLAKDAVGFQSSVSVGGAVASQLVDFLNATEQTERTTDVKGTLVGASLTRQRLELKTLEGAVINASVLDSQSLRGARLGSRYTVRVREKITRDLVTKRETITDQVVELSATTEAQDPVDEGSPEEALLHSELVPEGNDLSKIHRLLHVLSENAELTPEAIGVTTIRWVLYYRASARILGYVTSKGELTRIGRFVSRLPFVEFLKQTAVQFQVSDVGAAWLQWSDASSLAELRKQDAERFLLESVAGLSASNARRRAGTLRAWLKALASSKHPTTTGDGGGLTSQ